MLDINSNIKKYRKAAGLSQEALAVAVGYADRTPICKIESGKLDIALSKAVQIAEVLGVSLPELVGSTDMEAAELFRKMSEADKEIVIGIMKKFTGGTE